jgi:hypothetical protein
MSIVDIRQGLAGDEKHGGGRSPVAVEVAYMIYGGRQRNWLMMLQPRAKEA